MFGFGGKRARDRAVIMQDNAGMLVTCKLRGDVIVTAEGDYPLARLHISHPDPDSVSALLTWKSHIPATLQGRDSENATTGPTH